MVLALMAGSAHGAQSRRLIVVFGDPSAGAVQQLQRDVAAARCRLVDRDVDVVFVDADELRPLREDSASVESTSVAQALQVRPGDSDGGAFEMVLVGKDGGVKARTDDPAALDELLARIDTMPMRRAEVQRAGGADAGCKPDAG